jgi:hypothetical protein
MQAQSAWATAICMGVNAYNGSFLLSTATAWKVPASVDH